MESNNEKGNIEEGNSVKWGSKKECNDEEWGSKKGRGAEEGKDDVKVGGFKN